MTQRQARPELVSRATRHAFRELATGIVLREIDDMWRDEAFGSVKPSQATSGERRSLYQGYLDAVDWTDSGHVARAIRVFEQTAKGIDRQYSQSAYDLIERDGFKVLETGRIVGTSTVVLREGALAKLSDPGAIRRARELSAR